MRNQFYASGHSWAVGTVPAWVVLVVWLSRDWLVLFSMDSSRGLTLLQTQFAWSWIRWLAKLSGLQCCEVWLPYREDLFCPWKRWCTNWRRISCHRSPTTTVPKPTVPTPCSHSTNLLYDIILYVCVPCVSLMFA